MLYTARILKGKMEVLDLQWMEKLRKDFLMLMGNIPRVQNYDQALELSQAFNTYRSRFEELFFERFLNNDLKYQNPGVDAQSVDNALRAVAWAFSTELSLPMERADDYYTREQRFLQFQKKVKAWESGLRRKAQVFWKAFREQAASFLVDAPSEDQTELSGFPVTIRDYQQNNSSKMEIFKSGLALYRAQASRYLPQLLEAQLPIILECRATLDKGGEYNSKKIHIFLSALESPQQAAHFLAHEMGHHLWNMLSGEAQTFWRAAIRSDYGDLDLQELLNQWPGDAWAFQFPRVMGATDPILALQVDAITHDRVYSRELQQKADFQALYDTGERILKVPKHPITGYANKNPEEAFCEAIGMLVGYGPRAVLEQVQGWLDVVL